MENKAHAMNIDPLESDKGPEIIDLDTVGTNTLYITTFLTLWHAKSVHSLLTIRQSKRWDPATKVRDLTPQQILAPTLTRIFLTRLTQQSKAHRSLVILDLAWLCSNNHQIWQLCD